MIVFVFHYNYKGLVCLVLFLLTFDKQSSGNHYLVLNNLLIIRVNSSSQFRFLLMPPDDFIMVTSKGGLTL
jgi:hypothetical protein